MSDISEIDKNLRVETNIEREGLRFHSVRSTPFKIYGVYHDGEKFRRLPKDVAESTSAGVSNLSVKTAGGRVRFITDSPFVAIKAILPHNTVFPHMTLAGVAGFDMYASENGNEKIVKIFVPPVNFEDSYEGLYDFPGGAKERLITVNFPLYNEVRELYIGLDDGCSLKEAPEYKYEKPIVYYGSSITQGGCASRPGMCYTAILSRKYDIDHINLGFSGNGCGEPVMAEYIAGLDMQMFVYDYDYNSRSVEQYEQTHEPFFKIIRRAHPDMPIIFMTKPKPECYMTETDYQKLEIAKRTYANALASGDKNVYFIPGYELMADAGTEGFVDMTHPTDLGFVSMANRLSVEFDKILKKL